MGSAYLSIKVLGTLSGLTVEKPRPCINSTKIKHYLMFETNNKLAYAHDKLLKIMEK